jgi:hypothetical protein
VTREVQCMVRVRRKITRLRVRGHAAAYDLRQQRDLSVDIVQMKGLRYY